MDLFARLRSRIVLHRAWGKVRASGLRSDSDATVRAIRQFNENWLSNLERLSRQLRTNTFSFTGEVGVTLPKGKGKSGHRPLVIAPIPNRVVRRAILEVLQGYGENAPNRRHQWHGVPEIKEIMETPTSVGGIAERGVPEGLALVEHAINSKKTWFVRSDIQNFFTRIPHGAISAFVRSAVKDEIFANLFEQALATNLENQDELEERNMFKLFPDPEIGVAQGSALSALAGNIALREFDARMNDRGIVCIRYIDDFIILSESQRNANAAYSSAQRMLKKMGMDVYSPDDSKARKDGKVDSGNIFDGTDILGYRVSGHSRQPCRAAVKKFRDKLDNVVKNASAAIKQATEEAPASHQWQCHQAMVQLHRLVWGWSQSFRHTTVKHVFEQLDKEIDVRINAIESEAHKATFSGDTKIKRRVMGVHLLGDTELRPLPNHTQH